MEDRGDAAEDPDVGRGPAPDAEENAGLSALESARPARTVIVEDRPGEAAHNPHTGGGTAPHPDERLVCSARDGRPARPVEMQERPMISHGPHIGRGCA